MKFNPKISIIIPLYNCEKYIEQCLLSVFGQTYNNIEVLCIDNESKDAGFQIVKDIQKKYPNLIIDTAPNIYPHCWDEAKDRGLQLMTGDYCIVIGADDYLEPNFISKYVDIFSHAPEKMLALQSAIKGVQDGKETGVISHFYTNLLQFKQKLLQSCVVNTPTVMYNVELYRRGLLKGKPEKYSGAADYDLYCNLAENNILIYTMPQWLGYYYRWHSGQATWGMHRSNIKYDALIQEYWKNKWT